MILKSGKDYQPPVALIQTLQTAYPTIDVDTEIKKMDAWCICNPSNRKTPSGITRFINSWLSRAKPTPATIRTRDTTLQDDLNDTSWAL